MATKVINKVPKPVSPKAGSSASNTAKLLPNVNFSSETQKFLNASYGTEAAWYNDPQIGPVLKAALTAGKDGTALQGARYQDFIRTHAVDEKGAVVPVAADKSWFGTHGAQVRLTFGQKLSDPGSYNLNVQNVLNDSIIPTANSLGLQLDPATLQKVAEDAYTNGWGTNGLQVQAALVAQKQFVPGALKGVTGGAIGKANADFAKIASDYGITLPTDPAQLDAFIKGAIGANGDETAFTAWAKEQATKAYPFLKPAIDAGATVKGYFGNYATNIANTLGIAADSIDWSQPKWQSLVNPIGATEAPNLNDVLAKVKTDAQYGYDKSLPGINNAYDLAAQIKGIFGKGPGRMA